MDFLPFSKGYSKCFPSRNEAEAELIQQNIENELEIKNMK